MTRSIEGRTCVNDQSTLQRPHEPILAFSDRQQRRPSEVVHPLFALGTTP